ncbi:unannotated protein [freshwater metagenome]|uniref:Unannotated protein n=1 Tax=freshwater metagenome TaxID=449393 RepID=A0A6J7RIR0_9ZZZZ|nr:SDR family NAD(P)-dependent oxidoreductase [Actinomycetota bacterium]MSW36185.1 SDR family NAD(P)-dependent oxidoreductase [Actinomycetota bacterium]MSX37880.1 SDR family NAD(P)-dependent oxidoreductase [Actinomycetota bacterium]
MQVRDSVAVVTGAASGLGLATARRLTDAGARVVMLDLPASDGAARASEIGGTFIAADVTDPVGIEAALVSARAHGPVRVLVNCAGIGDPARTLGKSGPLALESFERVVRVNLIGTFNVARLAAAAMAETEAVDGERGVIVNTASVAAFDGQVGQTSYAASKAGIVGLTIPLARDLARHLIRVMTIAPGIFRTPILDGLSEQARASIASQVPHPARLGEPSEFADLVMSVIANPMLNGETIRLDGALRMGPQ